MENYKSEYIVNYSTGEVIDITIQVTEDGEVLYINQYNWNKKKVSVDNWIIQKYQSK